MYRRAAKCVATHRSLYAVVMKHVRRQIAFVLELLTIFIAPVAIIYFGLIPFESRLWVLGLYLAVIVYLATRNHVTLRKLGMRTDNLRRCFMPYAIFTALTVAGVIVVATFLGKGTSGWNENTHLLFLFLPLSFAQEFIYRGYLMYELRQFLTSALAVVIVNAVLFAWLHVVFPVSPFIILLSFAAGIGYAAMYYKFPNLFLAAFSHGVLNFFVVILYAFI